MRTMRCTEVAGRPPPDGEFTCRDIGDRGRYPTRNEPFHMPQHSDDVSSPIYADRRPRILLISYCLFVALTLAVSIAVFVSPRFAGLILPYFGWPIIGLFYAGTLKFVIAKLVAPESYANEKFRSAIGSSLVIIAIFGAFMAGLSWIGEDFDNPYLTVNALQPVWTVGVPMAWYIVFRRSFLMDSQAM